MIFKIKLKGYVIVEAETPEEAIEKAEDEDYIEKCEELGTIKVAPEDWQT